MTTATPRTTEPNTPPTAPAAISAEATRPSWIPAAFRAKPSSSNRSSSLNRSNALSLAVTALVVPALFATVALPAYAYTPAEDTTVAEALTQLQDITSTNAQQMVVSAEAAAPTVDRDAFKATSAAEMERAAIAAAYAAYSGPTAADFLANPPYPNFDLAQVAQVALQYQGVPYRFGGATPAGFDCSGLVLFVYAQFGISLPHSVSGTAAIGTPIATADALPGDIVILPGHSGIYMGNGTFIDAPDYGEVVQVRPIYDSNYYIVRVGI